MNAIIGLPGQATGRLGVSWGSLKSQPTNVSVDDDVSVPNQNQRPGSAPKAARPLAQHSQIAGAPSKETICIQLGAGLASLATGGAARLPDQIKRVWRTLSVEIGLVLPVMRIEVNSHLPEDTYAVVVQGIERGRGQLRPKMLLAVNQGGDQIELAGLRTREPAFGLPAMWIEKQLLEGAVRRRYLVLDPASVLATHVTELVRRAMPDLLSFPATQKLLDDLPNQHDRLISRLIPAHISIGGVQRVLQALLADRLSIRNLPTILMGIEEACAGLNVSVRSATCDRTVTAIVAHVRGRLAGQ